MRQRAYTRTGDFSFGSNLPFLRDSPDCVAQAIMSRLRLGTKEWFLDSSEGTPYDEQILGFNRQATRDLAIRTRVLDTPGVVQISEFFSFVDKTRAYVVLMTVDTLYGPTQVIATL